MTTITREDIDELLGFVKSNYGLDLSSKRTFVEMRLQKHMMLHHYDTFPPFFAFICADTTGGRLAEFISNLTVNYTLFNRESEQFNFLTNTVLPELVTKENDNKELRIWSAGCASGEEPYTLAMVLYDFFNNQKSAWDTQILATDLSTVVLKKAEAGQYPIESIRDLSANWVSRYFVRDLYDKDVVWVAPYIRNEVIFRKHNLMESPFHFKRKFHFIFCRNVMLYFDEPTRAALVKRLYDCLEEGGYLFVGLTESIDKNYAPFCYVRPSVYRKGVSYL